MFSWKCLSVVSFPKVKMQPHPTLTNQLDKRATITKGYPTQHSRSSKPLLGPWNLKCKCLRIADIYSTQLFERTSLIRPRFYVLIWDRSQEFRRFTGLIATDNIVVLKLKACFFSLCIYNIYSRNKRSQGYFVLIIAFMSDEYVKLFDVFMTTFVRNKFYHFLIVFGTILALEGNNLTSAH